MGTHSLGRMSNAGVGRIYRLDCVRDVELGPMLRSSLTTFDP